MKQGWRAQDTDKTGSLPVDTFMNCLSDLHAPLADEGRTKLLVIYDKRGEGTVSYDDLLNDHKYIHTVSSVSKVCILNH